MKFKFLKDYKQFKKGMYLEVPNEIYTGQIRLLTVWAELRYLLKTKCIKTLR
jgi:hypothetical protein